MTVLATPQDLFVQNMSFPEQDNFIFIVDLDLVITDK